MDIAAKDRAEPIATEITVAKVGLSIIG
jgi:hypothetical protein